MEIVGFEIEAVNLVEEGNSLLKPSLGPPKRGKQIQYPGLEHRVARPLIQKLPRPLEGGIGFGEAVVDPVGVAQLGEGAGAQVGDEPRPWILLQPYVLGHSRGAVRQIEHPLRIAEAQLIALPQQRLAQGPTVESLDLSPREAHIPEPARRLIEQSKSLLELCSFLSPTLQEGRRDRLDATDGLLVPLFRHLCRRRPGLLLQERRCQSLHAPTTEGTAGEQVEDNPAAIGRLQPAREEVLDLSLPEMHHRKTPPYGTQITRALQDFLTKDASEKPPEAANRSPLPGKRAAFELWIICGRDRRASRHPPACCPLQTWGGHCRYSFGSHRWDRFATRRHTSQKRPTPYGRRRWDR